MQPLKQGKKRKKRRLSRKVAKSAGTTNRTVGSGVEVIVHKDDVGEWIKPVTGEIFYIDEDALFPDVEFEFTTDVPGPYVWKWVMTWSAQVFALLQWRSGEEGLSSQTDQVQGGHHSSQHAWLRHRLLDGDGWKTTRL